MKKRYSRRYICEAIAYWKKQLRQLNESDSADAFAPGGRFNEAAQKLVDTVMACWRGKIKGSKFYHDAYEIVDSMAEMLGLEYNPFDAVVQKNNYNSAWLGRLKAEADHLLWSVDGSDQSKSLGTTDEIFDRLARVIEQCPD